MKFGIFLRQLRLDRSFGLREFAGLINMKPSNYSNMEQGKIPPPKEEETVTLICDTLGLEEGDQSRSELLELFREEKLHRTMKKEGIENFEGIPVLVRSVLNKELTPEKLEELTRYIQENF